MVIAKSEKVNNNKYNYYLHTLFFYANAITIYANAIAIYANAIAIYANALFTLNA